MSNKENQIVSNLSSSSSLFEHKIPEIPSYPEKCEELEK